nr:putative reverse transcriptase domain-containing protein [Tanacetum cinerariifolium]
FSVVVAGGHVGKSRAQMGEDDDFGTTTRGEEIDLMLFPLSPGPYHMPYLHEGSGVCRKALDQTITPAELRRTKSLIPLELLNYAHLHDKFDKKKGDVKLLHSKVTYLDSKIEDLQRGYNTLGQENRKLRSQRDAAFEEVRMLQSQLTNAKTTSDVMDGLREEVTQFVGTTVESLVRKLLSSDEFYVALARVASLGINYGAGKGLRMGRTDVEFVAAIQKVFNFNVGSKDDFDNALDDFPTTLFPFLSKIAATSKGGLSDVAQILPLFIRELSWEGEDFLLPPFHWRTYMFLSFAPIGAYCFIWRPLDFIWGCRFLQLRFDYRDSASLGNDPDFEGSWDVHLPLVEFSYNNSYHSSVRCVPFEALCGRKCRSPIMLVVVKEGQLIGPELVQEITEKISQIKDRLKAARDCMVRFGKKGKLSPRFVRPFEINERIGPVTYRLRLPEELDGVHDTFHVSNVKKCLADPTLEREFKKLKRSRIAIVKMELIIPDLVRPSTCQLLQNSSGDFGPELSFNKSASSRRLFNLARVILAEASKRVLSFGCSR